MLSRLLQLPREIRDLIYEFTLVREVIPIECAVIPISGATASRSPGFCKNLTESFPIRGPLAHRRIWSIPTFDVELAFAEGDARVNLKAVQMTYQLAVSPGTPPSHSIEIRLLQTCKQIYHEARKTFYGKNLFSFTADFRIPTAFMFLCDRPAESLLLISSMELDLTEDDNMISTNEAHYPSSYRRSDSLVLQYAYNYFTDLCTLLSTSRMRLLNLHLTIQSLAERRGLPPKTVAECLAWETLKTAESRPWIPSWLDPLLNLEGLDYIETVWIFDRPRLRRMADTLSLMRQHMLRGTKSGLGNLTHLPDVSNLEFWIYFPSSNNETTHHGRTAAEGWSWDSYRSEVDEFRPIETMSDTLEDQEPRIRRQHIQDMLRDMDRWYISVCELRKVQARGTASKRCE
jgi:hypothetical protein